MPFRDPIAVYGAANNLEAHVVSLLLQAAGLDAFVVEDLSPEGHWAGGCLPEIHRPQVWVEREVADLAELVLRDYERRRLERHAGRQLFAESDDQIPVECDHCGELSWFPGHRVGCVEHCSRCHAFIDVEAADSSENDDAEEDFLDGQA